MIRKTEKLYHRRKYTQDGKTDTTNGYVIERVRSETWWFLFVPIYTRENIEGSNL